MKCFLLLFFCIVYCSLNNLPPEKELVHQKLQNTTMIEITSFKISFLLDALNEIGNLLEQTEDQEDRKLLVNTYQQIFIKYNEVIIFNSQLSALFEENEYLSFQEYWQENSYELLQTTYNFLNDEERQDLDRRLMRTITFLDTYFNILKPPFKSIQPLEFYKNQKEFSQLFFFYSSIMFNTALLVSNRDLFSPTFIKEQLKNMREKLEKLSKTILTNKGYEIFMSTKMANTSFNILEFLNYLENNPTQTVPTIFETSLIDDLSTDLLFLITSFL